MPNSSSHHSHDTLPTNSRSAFLARSALGIGLATVGLFFGLIVWRLIQLPHSSQSAAQQRSGLVQHVVTPREEAAIEDGKTQREQIDMTPNSPLKSRREETHENTARTEANGDPLPPIPKVRFTERVVAQFAPPTSLPEVSVFQEDQIVEQRLRASEDDLRRELQNVPELRLLSDADVKNVRQSERDAQMNAVEAAQAELRAAQAVLTTAQAKLSAAQNDLKLGRKSADAYYQQDVPAYDEACRDYKKVADRYQRIVKQYTEEQKRLGHEEAAKRDSQKKERIGYETNLRFHDDMKWAAAQAGLGLGSRLNCQLNLSTAAQVAKLSKELRDLGFVTVPGVPSVRLGQGGRGAVNTKRGVFVNGQRLQPSDETSANRIKPFQNWCDQHHLESMSGTVPTLTQMLQIEDEATRLLLVRELRRVKNKSAAVELAVRAVADLSPDVRQAALAGLEERPSADYLPVLLEGMRYPWPPVADHAASALRALKPQEAVAPLIDLLDLPSPSAPVFDAKTKQYTVREVVRLNHLRNCLLCHAPSADQNDGLVRGPVPTPGQPLPPRYYEGAGGDFVRADITFLRQDFSINLPEENAAPWPNEQRYDFVVRTRFATPEELTAFATQPSNYPQRDAVLYALRGITAKNAGSSAAHWRAILGIAVQAPDETQGAPLDAPDKQTKASRESLEKDISSKEDKHPKR